jgi:hypothetical protein
MCQISTYLNTTIAQWANASDFLIWAYMSHAALPKIKIRRNLITFEKSCNIREILGIRCYNTATKA